MENFKEKLRICNIVMGISCVVLAVVVVLGFTGVIQPITGDSHWLSSWNGFVSGAATGVMLKMVFSISLSSWVMYLSQLVRVCLRINLSGT